VEQVGKLLEHLGYTAPFIYAAAAYGFFSWIDENASDNAKAALASATKLRTLPNEEVAKALVEVFDRIYTSPLLHWRAALRSLLLTVILTAIFVFEVSGSEDIRDFRTSTDQNVHMKFYAVALVANAVSDYLSLFIIRPWLAKCGHRPVLAMLSGTFLAMLVVVLGVVVRLSLSTALLAGPPISKPDHPLMHDMSDFRQGDLETYARYGIAIVGLNFVASIPAMAVFLWLPLFAVGLLVIRILTPFSWIVAKAQWGLKEGDQHPLKAVGCVIAVIVFATRLAWQTF
jgi:hypothetical protein